MNQDVLSAFHYLRSLCTSVWCWAKYDLPEKREAADYLWSTSGSSWAAERRDGPNARGARQIARRSPWTTNASQSRKAV